MTTPTTPTPVQRLYSIREAADLLGVGKDWIYTRIKAGNLRYVDHGRGGRREKLRIPADALQALIDAHTYTPEAA